MLRTFGHMILLGCVIQAIDRPPVCVLALFSRFYLSAMEKNGHMKHRRRKILKVGGAKETIARALRAREKFQTTPTLGQTAPIFERSALLRLDFLHKRTNGKSSRADLAAT